MFLNYKFGKKGAQNNIFLNSVSGGVRWGIIQHFAYHTWNKKIVGVPLVIAYCSPVTITEYFHSSFTFPHSVCQSYHLILEILHLNVSLFQCYDLERQLPVCQFKSLNFFEENSKGGAAGSGFWVLRISSEQADRMEGKIKPPKTLKLPTKPTKRAKNKPQENSMLKLWALNISRNH